MFPLAATNAQLPRFYIRKVFCLLICLLITGCESVTSNTASFDAAKFDEHFPGYEKIKVVEESTIFYLNDASKEYVRQRSALAAQTRDKALSLISDLFAPSQLALDYVCGANSVAQTTFDSGKANCLSLTILAYAMAQEAGMQVTFHQVFQQESWSQMSDFDLANGHVNLKISGIVRNTEIQGLPREKRIYTVDFFPTKRE